MTAPEHAPVPPSRLARVAAFLGILLLVSGLLGPVGGTAPAAAQDPNQVRLTLRRVDPQPAGPGDAVTLAGTLRNVGTTAVDVAAVRAHTGYRGLDTRSAVRGWALGSSDVSATRLLGEDALRRQLSPGEQARFRIRVPAGTVDPPFDFASLPLLLDVAGGEDASASLGRLRSYLVWDGQQEYDHQPLEVSWLVPLTAPADPDLVSTDARSRRQAWAQAAGEGSRATRLVHGLADLGATFVVDPALLAPVAPTQLGPVSGGPPEPEPSPTTSPEPPDPTEPTDPTTGSAGSPPLDEADDGATTAGPGQAPTDDEATATAQPGDDDAGAGTPGDPAALRDAAAPLRSALAAVPESRLWWLPTGDTDLVALQQTGAPSSLTARLLTRGPAESASDTPADVGSDLGTPDAGTGAPPTAAELRRRGRADVLWPVTEALSESGLAQLQQQWSEATGDDPAGVVVSAGTVDAGHQLTAEASLPSATDPQLRLLGYEPVLSGLLAESSAAAGVADRQRLLAELLAIYQEQPATRRTLLLVTPREDTTDPERLATHGRVLRGLPWVRISPAEALVGASGPEVTAPAVLTGQAPPPAPVGDAAALPAVASSPLVGGGVEVVESARELVAGAAQVVAGSESAAARWQEVLDQQYSVRWRGSPGWQQPLEAARRAAQEVLGGVHVNPTTVNFLADEGLIQVTVVNDLDLPVENLHVEVTPRNGRLRVTDPADPVTVGPNSRATVSFRARAVAAGDVPLDVRLTTPDGTELGQAEQMNVHVQPTGTWIYWVLGGLAGAVLLVGLVRALRSPRRQDPGDGRADEDSKEAAAP